MVKRCCINKCNIAYYSGLSFHSFPVNEELKKKWLYAVPVAQKITKESVVCSLHFRPSDFHKHNSRQTLKDNAVPSIFPVTCRVELKPLSTETTLRAAEQPRVVVPIPKIDPDPYSVRKRIKFESDLIDSKVNLKSDDTLSFAEDTDQPCEDLIQPSNASLRKARVSLSNAPVSPRNAPDSPRNAPVSPPVAHVLPRNAARVSLSSAPVSLRNTPVSPPVAHVSPRNALDPLSDTVRAGKDSDALTLKQAKQITQLTGLLSQRDKTIRELRLEINDLMNYISDRTWEAGRKVDAELRVNSKLDMKQNRHVIFVKREWSPDNDQATSETQTSTVCDKETSDILQTSSLDVQNTSDDRQESSVGIKRTLDSRESRPSISQAGRMSNKKRRQSVSQARRPS